jgi:hypothetical protein
MSTFEDGIWAHLVDRHRADRVEFRLPAPNKRGVRSDAAAALTVALAVAVAALVLVFGGSSSGPQPAYALTPAGGGSYTLSLYDISRAVPELNAKFAKLGIRVTVVPVRAACTSSPFQPLQAGPGSMTQTVTISNRGIPAGWQGFLAAERLPNGRIGLAQGDTPRPIPSCFPTTTSHGIPGPPGLPRRTR